VATSSSSWNDRSPDDMCVSFDLSFSAASFFSQIFYAFITFRVRRSQGEMYIGHGRLCVCMLVCVSVPRRIPTLLQLHGQDVIWGNGRGCPLVMYY